MSYMDRGLEVLGGGASLRHVSGGVDDPDYTVPLIVGGVVVVGGLVVWAARVEERRRQERQRGMSPMERSVDDCLHTVGQAVWWSM